MINTREQLRKAVHQLTDEADETLLIYMLSPPLVLEKSGGNYSYSAPQLADLQEASEAYKHGSPETYSEGYQRERGDEA